MLHSLESLFVLIMDVKVQTEEEDDGDEERDESKEDELLEEAGLLQLNSKLVLLLRQLVVLSLQKGVANIIHVPFFLSSLFVLMKLIINKFI